MAIIPLIVLILGFIFLSGIMALTDAAVLSVSAAEIETMVKQKKRGAAALKKVYRHITRGVVVIVAFTNTVNVFGPIIVGQKAVEIYGDPVIVFTYVLYPLVLLLECISKLMQRGTRRVGTEEQITSLVRLGSASGYIDQEEGRIIHRAFVLNDKTAEAIMTPLNRTAAIPGSMKIKDAVSYVREKRFSRFPVTDPESGSVTGIVLAADIFEQSLLRRRNRPVDDCAAPPLFANAEETADALLLLFKDEKKHMAIVRKGKKALGVVTLEDVLEELVGDIEDERD